MGRPRSDSERIRDYNRIARLYHMGLTQMEIAEQIGRSQSTVSRDIISLHEQWRKAADREYAILRAEQLDEYMRLKREYYEAWEASRTVTTIRGSGENDAVVTQKEGPGDPAFLQGVERMRAKIDEFWGIHAAKIIALVDEDFDQAQWSEDRRNRHAEALATLLGTEGDDESNGEDAQ